MHQPTIRLLLYNIAATTGPLPIFAVDTPLLFINTWEVYRHTAFMDRLSKTIHKGQLLAIIKEVKKGDYDKDLSDLGFKVVGGIDKELHA